VGVGLMDDLDGVEEPAARAVCGCGVAARARAPSGAEARDGAWFGGRAATEDVLVGEDGALVHHDLPGAPLDRGHLRLHAAEKREGLERVGPALGVRVEEVKEVVAAPVLAADGSRR
jgi:hypothetical protein